MENKKELKRLLCIVGSMDAGGAETFLMKIYRNLDKSKYQMDFFVYTQEKAFYDEEILSMGGRIYNSVPKTKSLFKSFTNLKQIVENEKYDYVMRISQHSLSVIELIAARVGGAKTLIFRSSNSATGGGKINTLLHYLFVWLPKIVPTIKIAPSTEAAEFMFGKDSVIKGRVHLINNAIDVDRFNFNKKGRDAIRKELNLEDKFVVGHVGRFNYQKNHTFLIDIFSEIHKTNSNSVLVLVGKGELENKIKEKINSLGLENDVVFTGVRQDVPQIMMAMDIFVFPSFYEGMPNTLIEAQATGLPCVVSDTITKEAKITNLVRYMSIDTNPINWAEAVLETKENQRENLKHIFVDKGFEIKSVTRLFERLIFNQ